MAKILVIDDDRSICETLEMYLTEEGYEVVTAATGTDGLNKFVETSPDVVIRMRAAGTAGTSVVWFTSMEKTTPVFFAGLIVEILPIGRFRGSTRIASTSFHAGS